MRTKSTAPDASHEPQDTQNATAGHDAPTNYERRHDRSPLDPDPNPAGEPRGPDDLADDAPNTKRPVDLAVAASLADEDRRVAEARDREQEAIARSQREEDSRVAARRR